MNIGSSAHPMRSRGVVISGVKVRLGPTAAEALEQVRLAWRYAIRINFAEAQASSLLMTHGVRVGGETEFPQSCFT